MFDTKFQDQIFVGLEAIAKFFGCSTQTIRRWIDHQGFPAGRLVNGRWAITSYAIAQWIAARNTRVGPYSRKGSPSRVDKS